MTNSHPKQQAIIAVSGVKNSGKTTLIEKLLPYLQVHGLQTAVIKHDGHTFQPDPTNTDTGRFMQAGAYGTAIYDGEKYKVIKRVEIQETDLMQQFPEADLILLEGFKQSRWPKLEVVRAANSQDFVCPVDTLLALVTDLPLDNVTTIPKVALDDIDAIAELIVQYVHNLRQ